VIARRPHPTHRGLGRRATLAAALALLAAPPGAVRAAAQQSRTQLDIALPAVASDGGPTVSTSDLLGDAKTRELLRNGFPARIHYRLELWRKSGLFENLETKTEWDVFVQYDPTSKLYKVLRTHDKVHEDFGGFGSVTSADAQIGRPYHVAIHPARSGRYYYNLLIDVQILTESDLDALQQSVQGMDAKNPIGAVRSGISALLSRVLGDKLHSEVQSKEFTAP
jgi:hypothetical protein